jgi:hypothetical protein
VIGATTTISTASASVAATSIGAAAHVTAAFGGSSRGGGFALGGGGRGVFRHTLHGIKGILVWDAEIFLGEDVFHFHDFRRFLRGV